MTRKLIKNRDGGFTLIELLLAVSIAAIIATTVYSLLWSGMTLNDRLRRVHENYMEALMADQVLAKDLENAVNLDLRSSYPDKKSFDGAADSVGFLTLTPRGIRHVEYFTDDHSGRKRQTGFMSRETLVRSAQPVEFLLRRETSLSDWLNGEDGQAPPRVVAAGIKKGSFDCHYAPFSNDIKSQGPKAIVFSDHWSDQGLPMVVRCRFDLNDPKRPKADNIFQRNFFLSPAAKQ